MSEIRVDIVTAAQTASDAIRQVGDAAAASAGKVASHEEAQAELVATIKALTAAMAANTAAQEAGATTTKRSTKADEDAKTAKKDLTEQAKLAASTQADLNSEMKHAQAAQETLTRISSQYASILQSTGSRVSELGKEWKSALSPAEKTAAKLAELNAFTSDADKQTEAYKATVAELTKKYEDQIRRQEENRGSQHKLSRSLAELMDESKEATKEVGRLSREGLERLADQAEKTTKKLDGIESIMSALNLPGADLVDRAKKITAGLGDLASTGEKGSAQLGMLLVTLGGFAAAGTVVAAGAAAMVAGIGAGTLAMAALVESAADTQEELQKFGEFRLPDGQRDSIEQSAAAVQGVGKVISAIGVQIARMFGPAIEMGATALVAFGLTAVDAMKKVGSSSGIVGKVVTFVTDQMIKLVDTARAVGDFFGSDTMVEGANKVRGVLVGIQEATNGTKDFGLTLDAVFGDDISKRAQALVKDIAGVNKATRDEAEAVKGEARERIPQARAIRDVTLALTEQQAALKANSEAMGVVTYDVDATIAKFEELANENPWPRIADTADQYRQASNDLIGAIGQMSERYADSTRSALDDTKEQIQKTQDALAKSTDAIERKRLETKLKHLKAAEAAEGKAALAAFRWQQSFGVAAVAIDTSIAIMKALTAPGGPTSPVNILAAVGAAATGALQIASILRTPAPSASGASASAPSYSASSAGAAAGARMTVGTAGSAKGTTGGDESVNMTQAGRYSDAVPVTDAYLPPTSSSQLLRTTPGDEVQIARGGVAARDRAATMGIQQAMLDEMRGLRDDMRQMLQVLGMRVHRQTIAPAGRL